MAQGIDATKTPAGPSHEALESTAEESDQSRLDSDQSRLDKDAMEGARRAEDRIHSDEADIPGSSIFTK
jgi:hypothetical protein